MTEKDSQIPDCTDPFWKEHKKTLDGKSEKNDPVGWKMDLARRTRKNLTASSWMAPDFLHHAADQMMNRTELHVWRVGVVKWITDM